MRKKSVNGQQKVTLNSEMNIWLQFCLYGLYIENIIDGKNS